MGGLIDIDHAALAPYWCTHTYNATAAHWMLILWECYCLPRQSCFSSNINKKPEAWKRLRYAGNDGFVFGLQWKWRQWPEWLCIPGHNWAASSVVISLLILCWVCYILCPWVLCNFNFFSEISAFSLSAFSHFCWFLWWFFFF